MTAPPIPALLVLVLGQLSAVALLLIHMTLAASLVGGAAVILAIVIWRRLGAR